MQGYTQDIEKHKEDPLDISSLVDTLSSRYKKFKMVDLKQTKRNFIFFDDNILTLRNDILKSYKKSFQIAVYYF